jgi:hypothetical protein
VRADRVDDLSRAATTDPSWRVRLQAVVVLGKLGDSRGAPALLRALHDPNETVRALAAQVLGNIGTEDHVAALERARHDPNPLVREKAAHAIEKLKPPTQEARPGSLHLEVGGIGSKAPHTPPELLPKLRELITRELARTPGISVDDIPGGRSGFMIDSAITSLNRHVSDHYVEVSCEVSFIVGRLPSKAMVMMTSGGATVQAPRGVKAHEERRFQVDALEGAVKGAHENLLAFLRTQQATQTQGRAAQR